MKRLDTEDDDALAGLFQEFCRGRVRLEKTLQLFSASEDMLFCQMYR